MSRTGGYDPHSEGVTSVPCNRVSVILYQGYGTGGHLVVFEPVVRVTLYLTDENGVGTCFGAA